MKRLFYIIFKTIVTDNTIKACYLCGVVEPIPKPQILYTSPILTAFDAVHRHFTDVVFFSHLFDR